MLFNNSTLTLKTDSLCCIDIYKFLKLSCVKGSVLTIPMWPGKEQMLGRPSMYIKSL